MVFVTGVVLVVVYVHVERRHVKSERIFDFYIAAEAILRDEERRWYGFEVTEVIATGEKSLEVIPGSTAAHCCSRSALCIIGSEINSVDG